MIWPFRGRRKQQAAETASGSRPEAEDIYDRAARNLIEQGVPPEKVARATRLVKRYAKEGVLPEGVVQPSEE